MSSQLQTQAVRGSSVDGSAPGASHAEAVLAAYEGYWQRIEAGEQISPEDYCEQFPALRSSLPNLLRAHEFVGENLEALQAAPMETAPTDWPQPGDSFLDYDLRRELGRGAFSRVYLATQRALGDRWVVLKLFRKPMGEARILGPLNHPNIVPINSLQLESSWKLGVICMPFVGSSTLQRLLDLIGESGVPTKATAILQAAEDEGLPQQCKEQLQSSVTAEVLRRGSYVEGVCYLGAQLADALAFIHKRGICHRDLKPSNVLLKPDGQPMLLDFNLSDKSDKPSVRMGGTLPYMSPEQLQAWHDCFHAAAAQNSTSTEAGQIEDDTDLLNSQSDVPALTDKTVSPQADVFSLGVLLYELLTGVNPFGPIPVKITAPELYQLIHDRHQQGFKPLSLANPAVDSRLAAAIESCLELDPLRRPESADALASRLRRRLALGWRRWLGRHTWFAIALCLFFTTVGIGGAYVFRRDPMQDAIALNKKGDTDLALERLGELLYREPGNFDARFLRARIYQDLSEQNKQLLGNALEDYRRLDRLRPEGAIKACLGYCMQRVRLNGDRSEIAGAIQYYLAALNLGFDNVRIRNNLGYAYDRSAELEKALEQFDAALDMDANAPMPLLNRAATSINLYFKYKDDKYLDQGIADVEHALQFGANADLHMTGARLHALAARKRPDGNIVPALDHLQSAISLGCVAPRFEESTFAALKAQDRFIQLTSQASAANYRAAPRISDPLP